MDRSGTITMKDPEQTHTSLKPNILAITPRFSPLISDSTGKIKEFWSNSDPEVEVTTQRQARAKSVTCHEAQLQQQKDQGKFSLFLWHRWRQEVTLRDKWCALNFQNIPIPPRKWRFFCWHCHNTFKSSLLSSTCTRTWCCTKFLSTKNKNFNSSDCSQQ